jgi:curved DNA-binding protein CbpA
MATKCPYKVLSLPKTATITEIKNQYRKLAMQLHPDRNGGDEKKSEQFKAVASAYDILTNPTEKKRYEHEKQANEWENQHRHRGGAVNSPFHNSVEWNAYHYVNAEDFDFFAAEEIFFDAVTGTMRRRAPKKGNKGNKSKNSQTQPHGNHDSFREFSPDEIEDIIRNSTPKKSQSSRRKPSGNSRRKKEDCTIS